VADAVDFLGAPTKPKPDAADGIPAGEAAGGDYRRKAS
jgi:hypothetical protein